MKKWLAILLVVLLVVPVITACGDDDKTPATSPTPTQTTPSPSPTGTTPPSPTETAEPTPQPPPEPTGTLRMGLATLGPHIDFLPWIYGAEQTGRFLSLVGEFLVYTDHETLEAIPGLAESWEISDDGKSITFQLRQGVEFHDGWGELTSDDVKFTFDGYMADVRSGSVPALRALLDRTEAPSPYEFTVYTTGAYAEAFLDLVSSSKQNFLIITCKNYIESAGEEEAARHPIGTGPYKFVKASLHESIELEALPSHWRVVPEFERVIFEEIPEESTRSALLKRGDIQLGEFTIEAAANLEDDGYTLIEAAPEAYTLAFWMHGQYPPETPTYDPDLPFLDERVREAMNLAINREEIAEFIFKGYAVPAAIGCYYPWQDEFEPYPYDPDRARQLLAEAGYEDGFSFELWDVSYVGQAPEMSEVVLALAGYWEAIGLNPKVLSYSLMEKFAQFMSREVVGAVSGESRVTSYQPWYSKLTVNFVSDATTCYYYDSRIEDLADQIAASTSLEEKNALGKQIAQILYDEHGFIPVVTPSMVWVRTQDVEGFVATPHSIRVLYLEYLTHSPALGTFRLAESIP